MSKFHFTGSNHGGKITGIDIQFNDSSPEKLIGWALGRWIARSKIKSITITTLQKRARKEVLDTADSVV